MSIWPHVCHLYHHHQNSQSSDSDYVLESFSDDEGGGGSVQAQQSINNATGDAAAAAGGQILEDDMDRKSTDTTPSTELRKLLRRRDELERSNKMQEKRHERYQVSGKEFFGIGSWSLSRAVLKWFYQRELRRKVQKTGDRGRQEWKGGENKIEMILFSNGI